MQLFIGPQLISMKYHEGGQEDDKSSQRTVHQCRTFVLWIIDEHTHAVMPFENTPPSLRFDSKIVKNKKNLLVEDDASHELCVRTRGK